MCGLDPADVLTVEDDPGDALIAAVGRLARCGAVRYVSGYDLLAGLGSAFRSSTPSSTSACVRGDHEYPFQRRLPVGRIQIRRRTGDHLRRRRFRTNHWVINPATDPTSSR